MKYSTHIILLFIISWFSNSSLKGQNDIVVNVNVIPPYDLEIEKYLDLEFKVVLNATNTSTSEKSVRFGINITSTNGIGFSGDISQFDSPITTFMPGESKMFSGEEFVDIFSGLTFDNASLSGLSPSVQQQILVQRVLPEGEYSICITAYDIDTRLPLSQPGCDDFRIVFPDRPTITYPKNSPKVLSNPNNIVNFTWSPPPFSNQELLLNSVYDIVVKDLTGLDGDRTELMLRLDVVSLFEERDVIGQIFTSEDQDFQEGHTYGVMVTIRDKDGQIAYKFDGHSEVEVFQYGEDVDFNFPLDIDLAATFPINGDTLPFTDMQFIVGVSPQYDYEKIDFEFALVSNGNEISNRTASNSWPEGIIDWSNTNNAGISDDAMFQFWLNDQNESYTLERGNNVEWSASATANDVLESPKLTSRLNVGMPTPRLIYPSNSAALALEPVSLKFHTGKPPRQLLPQYNITRIQNGGMEFGAQVGVKERFVVQVSQDEFFNEIATNIASELIEVPVGAGITDPSSLLNNIYKEASTIFTPLNSGTYYWRVIYLSDPDYIVQLNQVSDISESEIYRKSSTGVFTIGEGEEDDDMVILITTGFPEPDEGGPAGPGGGSGTEDEGPLSSGCETEVYFQFEDKTHHASLGEITEFQAGHFPIIDLKLSSQSGGIYSGEGRVKLDLLVSLHVGVTFSNVKLNKDGQMISGNIKTKKDASAPDIEDFLAFLTDDTKATESIESDGALTNYLRSNGGAHTTGLLEDVTLGVPIAVEPDIEGNKILLGITSITFGVHQASMTMALELNLGEIADNRWYGLAFKTDITPKGFGLNEITIAPSQDVIIGGGNEKEFELVVKANGKNVNGDILDATHLRFQCGCLTSFALKFELKFPNDILVKDTDSGIPDLTSPVAARFGFKFEKSDCNKSSLSDEQKELGDKIDANNFIVDFEMDPFQIRGVEGWGFTLDDGFVDFSTLQNPPNFSFPDDYQHVAAETSNVALKNTWQGFYLKEISAKAPKDFYKESGGNRLSFGIQNLIIDDTGFTGRIFADNIIAIADGEIQGFAFSLDQVDINFMQNNFVAGSLKGDFKVPVSKGEVRYEAVVAYNLPKRDISDDREEDEDSEWGFFMSVKPTEPIIIPIMVGTATVSENSYVYVKLGEVDKKYVSSVDPDTIDGIDIHLNGKIDISGENNGSGDDNTFKDLDAAINFKGIDYNLRYTKKLGFEGSKIGFASPQKFMSTGGSEGEASGFPVSITDFDFKSNFDFGEATEGNFCTGVEVSFKLNLNLMENSSNSEENSSSGGFEASTTLKVSADFFNQDHESDFDRVFKLTGIEIECISVGLKTGGDEGGSEQNGVSFSGEVCFIKNDPTYGSGIKGNLHVGLPIAEVDLAAMFGVVDDTQGEYRYWYVDGKVIFKEGGLSLGAISLIGLGGGIYWNMSLDGTSNSTEVAYEGNLVQQAGSMQGAPPTESNTELKKKVIDQVFIDPESGPVPKRGSKIFKLLLPIATTGDASVFNMDVIATVGIEDGRGLTHFSIIGDGYIMADISERDGAPIKADVKISYDSHSTGIETFEAGFDIYVDYDKDQFYVKGADENQQAFDKVRSRFVGAHFYLEKGDNADKWYFKMGGPGGENSSVDPGGLTAGISASSSSSSESSGSTASASIKLTIKNYFQVGNDIDAGFMPLPQLITDLLGPDEKRGGGGNSLTDTGNNFSGSRERASDTNEGFIMGLSTELDIDVQAFILYARLRLALGFDISLLNKEDSFCKSSNGNIYSPIGFDGWYATGQIYAGIEGALGIRVDFFGEKEIELFRLGAAFLIQGGFPNPTWAEGRAAVQFSVLGGIFEGSANFRFTAGEKCVPINPDPFGFTIINEISPANGKENVDVRAQPQITFNIPMNESFSIPVLGATDDEGNSTTTIKEYKPYISKISIDKEDYLDRLAFSEDNTSVTLRDSRLKNVLTKYEVFCELKARELSDGSWVELKTLQKDGAMKLWVEDTTSFFTTGELPDTIPNSWIKDAKPMVDQQYFQKYFSEQPPNEGGGIVIETGPEIDLDLSGINGHPQFGEIKEHGSNFDTPDLATEYFIEFFNDVERDFFYRGDRNFTETQHVDQYSYVIQFSPLSGDGKSHRFDLKNIEETKVIFSLPDLKSSTVYSVSIIRKEKTSTEWVDPNWQSTDQEGMLISAGQISSTIVDNYMDGEFATDKKTWQSTDRFTGMVLHDEMNFTSMARKLPSSMVYNFSEETILHFFFKTSKYRSFHDKMATASASHVENDVVAILTDEKFDIYDLEGETRKNDGHGPEYIKKPLIPILMSFDNAYWRDKRLPLHTAMWDATYDLRNTTFNKTLSSTCMLSSNLSSGTIRPINTSALGMAYGCVPYLAEIEKLIPIEDYAIKHRSHSGYSSMTYSAESWGISTIFLQDLSHKLNVSEIQEAWDETVIESLPALQSFSNVETHSSSGLIKDGFYEMSGAENLVIKMDGEAIKNSEGVTLSEPIGDSKKYEKVESKNSVSLITAATVHPIVAQRLSYNEWVGKAVSNIATEPSLGSNTSKYSTRFRYNLHEKSNSDLVRFRKMLEKMWYASLNVYNGQETVKVQIQREHLVNKSGGVINEGFVWRFINNASSIPLELSRGTYKFGIFTKTMSFDLPMPIQDNSTNFLF